MSVKTIDIEIETAARAHQDKLTKPRGALGRLEDVACWFAARQSKVNPDQLNAHIAVFAGDHGVVDEGISAYPYVVTGEMVKNFSRGGAAINVLAGRCDASLAVVDVGVGGDLSDIKGVIHANVCHGTANLLHEAAMSDEECAAAIEIGRAAAIRAIAAGANLLIAGDMGIGNTTASACIICRLTGAGPEVVVGSGTGIDDAGRARKIEVVYAVLARIAGADDTKVLAELGGLEIAAMAGLYLQAAESGVPVLIDGFIAAAAALAARAIEADTCNWMLASHISQENGHAIALGGATLVALSIKQPSEAEASLPTLLIPGGPDD